MPDRWFSFKLMVQLALDFIVTVMQPAIRKPPVARLSDYDIAPHKVLGTLLLMSTGSLRLTLMQFCESLNDLIHTLHLRAKNRGSPESPESINTSYHDLHE